MLRPLVTLAIAMSASPAQPTRYPAMPIRYTHLATGLKVVLAPDSRPCTSGGPCDATLVARTPRAGERTGEPQPDVGPLDSGRPVAATASSLRDGVRVTLLPFGESPKALVRLVVMTGGHSAAACGLAHAYETAGQATLFPGGQFGTSCTYSQKGPSRSRS